VSNTIIALTASCLGAYVVSIWQREKFSMEDILNATLAGGVIIGAGSGIITMPAAAFAIGLIGGIVSTYCFVNLTPKFEKFFHIHDTCGVQNLHGIPGFLGGILSAVVIASYNTQPVGTEYLNSLPFKPGASFTRTFTQQAAVQVGGTFISLGIAIITAIITGIILACTYSS
jgi:ammonium transporter Rh